MSNTGKVRNALTKKVIGSKNKKGYMRAYMYGNGGRKCVFTHRLVAEAFLPKPPNATEVNHIDGDKLNNNVENLEWCDHNWNMHHSYYKLNQQKGVENRKVKVQCIETGKVYNSGCDADRDLGLVIGSALKAARGHSGEAVVRSARGYHFKII